MFKDKQINIYKVVISVSLFVCKSDLKTGIP